MIDIDRIRYYFQHDAVYVTNHAAERYRQRGISTKDVRKAVEGGIIIEQYPDDYPFPSCLILGRDENGRAIHVCMSDENTSSRIITAYIPDLDKWEGDLRTRKELK